MQINKFNYPDYNSEVDIYFYLYKLSYSYSKFLFEQSYGKLVNNQLKISLQVDLNLLNDYILKNKFYWEKDFMIYKFDYNFNLQTYIPNRNEYKNNINKRSCLLFDSSEQSNFML